MHNLLFNPPDNTICDHKDRNGLNNQNDNIRYCTNKQNSYNVGPKKNNKSGVPGIYWNPANGNWRTRIKVNGKAIEIGSFNDLDEAKTERIKAEQKYYGEFAPTSE